jgi:hypothetical protein
VYFKYTFVRIIFSKTLSSLKGYDIVQSKCYWTAKVLLMLTVLGRAWELGYRDRQSDKAKGWTFRGANPGRGDGFVSSLNRPDRLWGPPSPHFNGYHGTSRGKVARAS